MEVNRCDPENRRCRYQTHASSFPLLYVVSDHGKGLSQDNSAGCQQLCPRAPQRSVSLFLSLFLSSFASLRPPQRPLRLRGACQSFGGGVSQLTWVLAYLMLLSPPMRAEGLTVADPAVPALRSVGEDGAASLS